MPYVDAPTRERLSATNDPRSPGELNYALTLALKEFASDAVLKFMCLKYVELTGGASYGTYNAVMGVLECARREHIRRDWLGSEIRSSAARLSDLASWFYDTQVAPYEDAKILENGDIE